MFPENFKLQQVVCRALAATSNVAEVSKQAVIDAGGIGATMEAMNMYPELRWQALQVLSLLSLRNETKDAFADENMFRAIVNDMSHPMDVTGFFYTFGFDKKMDGFGIDTLVFFMKVIKIYSSTSSNHVLWWC